MFQIQSSHGWYLTPLSFGGCLRKKGFHMYVYRCVKVMESSFDVLMRRTMTSRIEIRIKIFFKGIQKGAKRQNDGEENRKERREKG